MTISGLRPAPILPVIFLMFLSWPPQGAQAVAPYPGPSTHYIGHKEGLALGDFDEDGRLDAFLGESFMRLARGHGDGFFDVPAWPSPMTYDGMTQPCAGDFNGDGHLDVVGNSDTGPAIALGHGDGSFGPLQNLPGNPFNYFSTQFIAGDFTGDGDLDLVLVLYFYGFSNYGLAFARGRGDGTFDPPAYVGAGLGVAFANSADLDHDGSLDLVVRGAVSQEIVILAGHGDGTFDTPAPLAGAGNKGFPILADFDGDGRQDLLVVDGTSSMYVRRGLDGGLSDPSVVDLGVQALHGAGGDWNGDGCDDLAVVTPLPYGWTNIRTFRSRCDGTWDGPAPYIASSPPDVLSWAVGDVDSDGRMDLVVVADPESLDVFNDDFVTTYFGHPDGAFGRATEIAPGAQVDDSIATDIDGDGRMDVVLATHDPNEILVAHGTAPGFGPIERIATSDRLELVRVGDVNGDGLPDLVAESALAVSIFFALPGGGYGPQSDLPGTDKPSWTWSLAVLDLDGDGVDDIAVNAASGLAIFLGSAVGTPPQVQIVPVAADVTLAVGDFNGDGRADLAFDQECGAVWIVSGGPAPPFNVWPGGVGPCSGGDGARSLSVADFNEDGRADLAVSGTYHVRVFNTYQGLAQGGLGSLASGTARPWPGAVVAADVNRDGHADLIVVTRGGWAILAGDGAGGLGPQVCYQAAGTIDIDGDGWLDQLAGNMVIYGEGNRPPVALASASPQVECTSPAGAEVRLDGSASFDPDSTAGRDDIASMEWFEENSTGSRTPLGSGRVIGVVLPLGAHAITLVVTDRSGASAETLVPVAVVDTTPPSLTVSLTPSELWPAMHQMIPVQARIETTDLCGPSRFVLVAASSSEPDDAMGNGDGHTMTDIQGADLGTSDIDFMVRAERAGNGPGRTYRFVYEASDPSGNLATSTATVFVPRSRGPSSVNLFDPRPGVVRR